MDRETFICDCHSLEHQYTFWYDEEYNQLYFEPHLFQSGTWYQRFWHRIKYVFGYTSQYGAFDDVVIKPKDASRLIEYLEQVKDVDIDKVVDRGRD